MIVYHFNPNTYGMGYFIMAEDKLKAHKALLAYLETKSKDKDYGDFYTERLEIWKKVNVLDDTTFPKKYTLDVYGEGEVIESEIS